MWVIRGVEGCVSGGGSETFFTWYEVYLLLRVPSTWEMRRVS